MLIIDSSKITEADIGEHSLTVSILTTLDDSVPSSKLLLTVIVELKDCPITSFFILERNVQNVVYYARPDSDEGYPLSLNLPTYQASPIDCRFDYTLKLIFDGVSPFFSTTLLS